MKKKVCILTATRAEYGLLKPLIRKLSNVKNFDVRIAVTGMHLSSDFGMTYQEIIEDGFPIDKKIDIQLNSDTPVSTCKSMGLALAEFAEYFDELKPDLLIVLGDRYETLAVCCAAMNFRIPIAHLYGGESTEGAMDEAIRHAISKMSYLHFTSTESYRKRVIQLGESPDRVFNVGGLGVENIMNTPLLSKNELEKSLGLSLKRPYAVVTYHPVTLEGNQVESQVNELLKACDRHKELFYIFTKANADTYGRYINERIEQFSNERENTAIFSSLGMVRYLSALKYSCMVIGNSSSGILEAPALFIPTINIGDRQKGRIQCATIINCNPDGDDISKAMDQALSKEFLKTLNHVSNPYGEGKTSDKILEILSDYLFYGEMNLKKKFYDISYEL